MDSNMRTVIVTCIAIWFATCGGSLAQTSQDAQFVVIGNGVGDQELTKAKLRTIFRGEQQYWADNRRILLVLPSSKFSQVESIMNHIYNQRATSVHKFWLSLVFQGRAQAPVFVDDPQEVVDYVGKNKGAIGVIINGSVSVPNAYIIRVSQ
jgi:ABC-type phosphate transport system substrate-binding protein